MPSRYTDYTELAGYFPTCASVANFLAQPRGSSKSGLRLSLYISTKSRIQRLYTWSQAVTGLKVCRNAGA